MNGGDALEAKVPSLQVLLSLEEICTGPRFHLLLSRTMTNVLTSIRCLCLDERNLLYPNLDRIQRTSLNTTHLFDVILAGSFVRGFEEAGGVFAKPLG